MGIWWAGATTFLTTMARLGDGALQVVGPDVWGGVGNAVIPYAASSSAPIAARSSSISWGVEVAEDQAVGCVQAESGQPGRVEHPGMPAAVLHPHGSIGDDRVELGSGQIMTADPADPPGPWRRP